MIKTKDLSKALCLTVLVCSEIAFASGFRLSNQSAFVTGRGNAFVATANDASAIYYNPAGLSKVQGENIQLGAYNIHFSVDYENEDSEFGNEKKWQTVPHFFYSKEQESFTWGLGVYAPFGLGNSWTSTESTFSTIARTAEITYLTLAPAVAYRFSEKLTLGASLNLNYAEIDLTQGVGLSADDRLSFKGDDIDINVTLGLLWEPTENHHFGIKYRSASELDLDGTANYTGAASTRSSMDASLPDILTIGYSFKPNADWDIGLDLEEIRWSSFDMSTITNSPLGDLALPFNWENGKIWQLGVTRFYEKYSFSAGYNYNESVQNDFLYNPAISDADRHWLNFGLASHDNKYPWSIAYQYGFSDRTVDGDITRPSGETANGKYDTQAHSIIFTLGYAL